MVAAVTDGALSVTVLSWDVILTPPMSELLPEVWVSTKVVPSVPVQVGQETVLSLEITRSPFVM